ncbi:MAG: hypothetical protein U0O24_00610 [Eggerthellaceae bacterium]
MYIYRKIVATIQEMPKQFKVVFAMGAHQVGKITVLKNSLGDAFSYVTRNVQVIPIWAIYRGGGSMSATRIG